MYTWDPDEYGRSSSEQFRWARELLAKVAWKGDERVLDIGCGDGRVSAQIARLVPRGEVIAIDSSREMIAKARKQFPRFSNPRLSFRVGDARDLRFDSAFDLVFSNAALHWVKDHRPVLRGISRSLKRGGRVLLQMGGRGNGADVIAVIDERITRDQWQRYFVNFTFPYGFHHAADYRGWLQQAGLDVVRLEMIPKDMVHDDPAAFCGWLRSTWLPYTQRLPAPLREEFIADIAQEYVRRFGTDAAGRVHVRMVRLEVEAVYGDGRWDVEG